jgi:Ion channel
LGVSYPDGATNSLGLWREVFTVLAVVMIQWVLMRQIFRPGPITAVRIQGAIAVYLLFGISWAYGYVIVLHFNPHAFQSTIELSQLPAEWMYFSFVTLTTLGYGVITPLSTPARSLAIGEALTGQLYLAVLLARRCELCFRRRGARRKRDGITGFLSPRRRCCLNHQTSSRARITRRIGRELAFQT